MKIHFLGTCAGTEPIPGRRHTAMILESGNKFYQFDAGENLFCALVFAHIGKCTLEIVEYG